MTYPAAYQRRGPLRVDHIFSFLAPGFLFLGGLLFPSWFLLSFRLSLQREHRPAALGGGPDQWRDLDMSNVEGSSILR